MKTVQDVFNRFKNEEFDEEKASEILKREKDILKKTTGPLKKCKEEIQLMVGMVKDYLSGDYKGVPAATISAVCLTCLYVFSPVDLVPDVLIPLGLVDDASVVALCLKMASLDIELYRRWWRGKNKG